MSRTELVNYIAEEAGLTKADATRAYDALVKGIEKGLKESGKVTLTGEQAAAYVKERMSGTSYKSSEHGDYGRTRRQRDVFISMMNIFKKGCSHKILLIWLHKNNYIRQLSFVIDKKHV